VLRDIDSQILNTKEFFEILWNLFALRLVKGTILILMQSVIMMIMYIFSLVLNQNILLQD
jgi:hypothetical protein